MPDAPRPSQPSPFELSGGSLCLDFANTWGDRARPETDRLAGYGDLLAFARQAGIASAPVASALSRLAAADPAAAAGAVARARALRDAVAGLFSAQARGREASPADVERLNEALVRGLTRLRLDRAEGGYRWRWSHDPVELDAPLAPIARSAAELLTSPELQRVRECDGADCTWLFVDGSRSRSRRWCSMASCGNRAKARRHYRRRRGD